MSPADRFRPTDLFLITESPEDREARVLRISASVADGAYEVPAGAVADSLVAFCRRDLGPVESGNPGFDENSC